MGITLRRKSGGSPVRTVARTGVKLGLYGLLAVVASVAGLAGLMAVIDAMDRSRDFRHAPETPPVDKPKPATTVEVGEAHAQQV